MKNDRKAIADIVFVTTMSLVSAGLRALVPMNLLFNGKYDDALMVNMGQQIGMSEAKWTQLSMIKSIGYPLFVRLSVESRVSPVLLAHIMYLGGAAFLAWQLRTRLHRGVWAVMIVALALNPVLFGTTASRVYRDIVTMAIALLFAATTMALLSAISSKRQVGVRGLLYGASLIVLGTAMHLVRNDTLWVILLVPLSATRLLLANWKTERIPGLVLLLCGNLLFVGVPQLSNVIGAKFNQKHFGAELADDFYHGWFPNLIKEWSSVEVSTERRYTPINRLQRETTYAHSPTLRSIADSLEGPKADGWRSISCQATSGEVCDDIAGGYFPFALREAIDDAYRPKTERDFQAILKRAAGEIASACDRRVIKCGDRGLNVFLPALNEVDVNGSIRLFVDYMFTRVLHFRDSFQFDRVAPIDGDTVETVRNWTSLVESSNGQKTSTISGMYAPLRFPIRAALTIMSYLLTASAFLGILGGALGFRLRSATNFLFWTAFSYTAISGIYVLIHSIVGANSFGPMIYAGNKEMSYLVQPTPFVIVAAACGWSILLDAAKSRNVRGMSNVRVME